MVSWGSSPLARGTRGCCRSGQHRRGLIPARAGNTALLLLFLVVAGAHPRSRGEHIFPTARPSHVPGSSPLARGTPFLQMARRAERGLIPARAGNTYTVYQLPGAARAHPRSRGEHAISEDGRPPEVGSSPLARGTPALIVEQADPKGLIPARAGNTAKTSPP